MSKERNDMMSPCKHEHCHGDSCIYKVPIFAGLVKASWPTERLVSRESTGVVRLYTWKMNQMSLSYY